MKEIFESIVTQTGEYLKRYNLKSMVLGLSGGLDSTVCAAIGCEVAKRYGMRMIGISLPCSSNSSAENDTARDSGMAFCDRFVIMNLQDLYGLAKFKCDTELGESTPLSQGNIKARLRMLMLYNTATINGGLVIDTDNLSEHYLGFWTIHGDVGDYKPIGRLWKTEVYELARWLRDDYATKLANPSLPADNKEKCQVAVDALTHAINITPTDGNAVTSGGDMDQIAPGYTYNEVDIVLRHLVENDVQKTGLRQDIGIIDIAKKYFNSDMDMVERIANRYYSSAFKRNTGYVGARV